MKVAKIEMAKGDRMIRLGFGQHYGAWFFRVDLWWIGWRITH